MTLFRSDTLDREYFKFVRIATS